MKSINMPPAMIYEARFTGRTQIRFPIRNWQDIRELVNPMPGCLEPGTLEPDDDASPMLIAKLHCEPVGVFFWDLPYDVDEITYAVGHPEVKLKITKVRAQRIQDMSAKDVAAEGQPNLIQARVSWDSRFGKQASKCWQTNPYVWVYEFELVEETPHE